MPALDSGRALGLHGRYLIPAAYFGSGLDKTDHDRRCEYSRARELSILPRSAQYIQAIQRPEDTERTQDKIEIVQLLYPLLAAPFCQIGGQAEQQNIAQNDKKRYG